MPRAVLSFVLLTLFKTVFGHGPDQRLMFVENKGQWPSQVSFKVDLGSSVMFLENGGFTWNHIHADDLLAHHDAIKATADEGAVYRMRSHAYKVLFENAAPHSVVGEQAFSSYFNYFIGNDPSRWASHAKAYEAVRYNELWDGVGMRVYASNNRVKYDFLVAPGADPQQIALRYDGADSLKVNNNRLFIYTSVGVVIEDAPYAYQMAGSHLEDVHCEFILDAQTNRVSFGLPEGYDTTRVLVIDPVIIASTLSGSGFVWNYGHTASFDEEGNIFTGGINFGGQYPTTLGAFEEEFPFAEGAIGPLFDECPVFSKLNQDGSQLIWATYLGGSFKDFPHSIIVNESGDLFVFGTTSSLDFPVTEGAFNESKNSPAAFSDIFVARLSADGSSLIGSTYLGGSADDGRSRLVSNLGDNYRGEIILDTNGNPIICAVTQSPDFPITAGAFQSTYAGQQDAVVFGLDALLTSLSFSSYFGGNDCDNAFGVRVAQNGDLIVSGSTSSPDLTTTPGAYQSVFQGGEGYTFPTIPGNDCFVARFNADASQLLASTYYGSELNDHVVLVDLDNDDRIWVFGQSNSPELPITDGVFSEPTGRTFIAQFDDLLTTLEIGTRFATSASLVPAAFLVDECGYVYISGYRALLGISETDDAFGFENPGTDGVNFYVAAFAPGLIEREFGSYYTGHHVDGGTSRFDKSGIVYQGVCSGGGFNTTANAWATEQQAGWDVAAFKLDFQLGAVNAEFQVSENVLTGCAPFTVDFTNLSNGNQFVWDFGDGSTLSNEANPSHTFTEPGNYTIQLISIDSLTCNLADTSFTTIFIGNPQEFSSSFTYSLACETLTFTSNNTSVGEGLTFEWDMGDGSLFTGSNVTYSYSSVGTYTVTLTAIEPVCGTSEVFVQEVFVFDELIAAIGGDNLTGCAPYTIEFVNNSQGSVFLWDFGDGSPPQNGQNVQHVYELPGEYTVTLIVQDNLSDCAGEETTTAMVTVLEPPFVEALFDQQQVGACESLTVEFIDESAGDDLILFWQIEDVSYTSSAISHAFTAAGTFTVSLTATEPICNTSSTFEDVVTVLAEIDLEGDPVQYICANQPEATIGVSGAPHTNYEWSTGETTSSIVVFAPGVYEVTATANNCTQTQVIQVNEVSELNLFSRSTACEGTQTPLRINEPNATQFQWCDGEPIEVFFASEAGEYCYSFVDEFGCRQQGTFVLELIEEGSVYVPNAFTPNNDGINDVFKASGENVSDVSLSVWNRWGEKIFETIDLDGFWDGSYNGGNHYTQNEVYTWQIEYRSICSATKRERKGTVLLIR